MRMAFILEGLTWGRGIVRGALSLRLYVQRKALIEPGFLAWYLPVPNRKTQLHSKQAMHLESQMPGAAMPIH